MLESKIKIELATDAILAAARRNPAITAAGLQDELERGEVAAWLHLAAVRACNASQWSGAMERAIAALRGVPA